MDSYEKMMYMPRDGRGGGKREKRERTNEGARARESNPVRPNSDVGPNT